MVAGVVVASVQRPPEDASQNDVESVCTGGEQREVFYDFRRDATRWACFRSRTPSPGGEADRGSLAGFRTKAAHDNADPASLRLGPRERPRILILRSS